MTSPATPRRPDVWVKFLQTVEPSSTDRARYDHGSTWAVSAARAEQLVAAGEAEVTDPPAAALREVTEPLEPLEPLPPAPEWPAAPASDVADADHSEEE